MGEEEGSTEVPKHRLYLTATGGIGNVNKPESHNRAKGHHPLSSAKVLKLPWKRPKGGAAKGSSSLLISLPASELSMGSDGTTSESQPDSLSEEGHAWASPTQELSPRIPDPAASWVANTCMPCPPDPCKSPSARPVQAVPAPARLALGVCSSSINRGAEHPLSSPTFGSIPSPSPQAATFELSRDLFSAKSDHVPQQYSHGSSKPSSPRMTSFISRSSPHVHHPSCDASPENFSPRFAMDVSSPKSDPVSHTFS